MDYSLGTCALAGCFKPATVFHGEGRHLCDDCETLINDMIKRDALIVAEWDAAEAEQAHGMTGGPAPAWHAYGCSDCDATPGQPCPPDCPSRDRAGITGPAAPGIETAPGGIRHRDGLVIFPI